MTWVGFFGAILDECIHLDSPGMAATALALELLEPGSHVLAMRRNMGRVMSVESWVDIMAS